MSTKVFGLDTTEIQNGLLEFESKFDSAIHMFAETQAKNLEKDAKLQARWTDRTGHARQRLRGFSEKTVNGRRIVLSHGVDYGLWLELAHEKKYAIVEPTVRLSAPFILSDLRDLVNKMNNTYVKDYDTSYKIYKSRE
jgi:hypothetical protein